MNVLITGGTGFIGSRLALACLGKRNSLTALGREKNVAEAENRKIVEAEVAEVILASVTHREKMFELLQGVDLVYHLAAAQHEANVPDQQFWEVNVTGTRNLLDASVNTSVKRFVHGSTIGVYGPSRNGSIHEQSPTIPDNIYGITKLEAEKLVLSFKEKIPVVITRISETYGPGDRRLLKLFKAIKKNVFFMIGEGTNLHHLIYIDDLIEGLFLAATVEKAAGNIFILAGKEPLTTNHMVSVIAKQLDTKMPKLRIPLSLLLTLATIFETVLRPMRIQPPLHRRRLDFFKKSFVFSRDHSQNVLGFLPKFTFQQGVTETARWYKDLGYI